MKQTKNKKEKKKKLSHTTTTTNNYIFLRQVLTLSFETLFLSYTHGKLTTVSETFHSTFLNNLFIRWNRRDTISKEIENKKKKDKEKPAIQQQQ